MSFPDDTTRYPTVEAALANVDTCEELDLNDPETCEAAHVTSIPESISQLVNLKSLDCTGSQITALPESIGLCSDLKTLNLSCNYELASLPESLGQLKRLESLNLRYNSKICALPSSIARLSNLTCLSMDGCGLIELPFFLRPCMQLTELAFEDCSFMGDTELALPPGLDGMAIFDYLERREQTDPIRALAVRPMPRAFTAESFESAWQEGDEEKRAGLLSALLTMCEEVAFLPPVTEEKWRFLEAHVFPLRCVWDAPARFAKLQDAARRSSELLENECRALLASLANDSSHGRWVCFELEPVAGDIASAGGRAKDGRCWLDPALLAAAAVVPEADLQQFDADVLPPMMRQLASSSFDAFDGAVRAVAAAAAGAAGGGGGVTVECARAFSVKAVKRMTAKVHESYAEAVDAGEGATAALFPVAARLGDGLRASIAAADAAGVRAAWEALLASPAFELVRLKNKFRTAAAEQLDRDGDQRIDAAELEAAAGAALTFPNLHANLLFQAPGCAPLVVEVQIQHAEVLHLAHQDHKLFEVIRAETMGEAAESGGGGGGGGGGGANVTALTKQLEELQEENARLKEAIAGGGGVAAVRASRNL